MNLSSIGKAAKSVLQTVAPLIGTAVGGPFGTIAGALLSKALGTKPGDSAAAEQALLSATPEQLLQLKQAEEQFQEQMTQLGISRDKLTFDDLANARALEVQTKSKTPSILSYTLLGTSLLIFGLVVAGVFPVPSNPQAAVIYGSVLTFLFTESKSILGYWFGSTIGEDKKSAALTDIAKQP